MMPVEQLLARRYASAYLNVFKAEISKQDLDAIDKARIFFCEHKKAIFFLSLPTIREDKKIQTIANACAFLKLPASCMKLIAVLIKEKRAFLCCDVLEYIIKLYQRMHHIMDVVIESSPEIDEQQQELIRQFLSDATNHAIDYTYKVNHDLIAGIRASSDTVLWEYSIAKKLRAIRLLLQDT